jgi:UPF0271 protein
MVCERGLRTMNKAIDLNADLGEGNANDAALLDIVSSCNIACGGHAGDENSMRATIILALRNGVAIGAHPSYPDRSGFGRRSRFVPAAELHDSLVEQMAALARVAGALGAPITHVKPHGALYNDAADDRELADVIARAVAALPTRSALVGQAGSASEDSAAMLDLRFVAEAFIDRAYRPNGRLVPRSVPGSVHTDLSTMTAQAESLAIYKQVVCATGELIDVRADTLCVHGDTPEADAAARAVRDALEKRGVEIRAIGP